MKVKMIFACLKSVGWNCFGRNVIVCFCLISMFLFISMEFSQSNRCKNVLEMKSNHCETVNEWMEYSQLNENENKSLDDQLIWCLEMKTRLNYEQYLPISPILRPPSLNSTVRHHLPYRYSQWNSTEKLPRRLTRCEHFLAMNLIEIIQEICQLNEIEFLMSDGTLLGSWRHHDITPWDDDIDLMVNIDHKDKFTQSINQMNNTLIKRSILQNQKTKREYHKISFEHTPSAGGYSWNFPFVDVFFFVKNETHLWQMNDSDTTRLLNDIYPLKMRPLGELWLPGPSNPREMFSFDPYDQCQGHFWDHRIEIGMKQIFIKCSELEQFYPFVHRNNQSNRREILKLNHSIVHTIIF